MTSQEIAKVRAIKARLLSIQGMLSTASADIEGTISDVGDELTAALRIISRWNSELMAEAALQAELEAL